MQGLELLELLKRNDETQQEPAGLGITLLELAEQLWLVLEYGYRVGTYGSCTVGLVEVKVREDCC